jgi:hypothetical protein
MSEMGGASRITLHMMNHLGFREGINIRGGFLLWQDEELPYAQILMTLNISYPDEPI